MRRIFCRNVLGMILVLQFIFLTGIVMQEKSYADSTAPSITGTSIGTSIGKFTTLYNEDSTATGSLTLNIDKTATIYLVDSTQLCGDIKGNNTITASQVQSWAGSSSGRPSYIDFGISQYVSAGTAGGTYKNDKFTGLTINAKHYIYVVLKGTDGCCSNVLGPYTLEDSVKLVFSSYYPTTRNNTGLSIDLVVKSQKISTAYYSIIPTNSDNTGGKPSASDVINGISGATKGSISISSANTEAFTTIGNLIPNTTYNIYVALKDQNGNICATATQVQIKTAKLTISLVKSATSSYLESDGKEQDGSEGWKLMRLTSGALYNAAFIKVKATDSDKEIIFDKSTSGYRVDNNMDSHYIQDNCEESYTASSAPGIKLIIKNEYLGSGWSIDTTDHLSDGKTISSSLCCKLTPSNGLLLDPSYPNSYYFARYHRITASISMNDGTKIDSATQVIKTHCSIWG